ncbi:MAG: DUF4406 domain-containing protein [Deltaproteobacteria bacterium]|nr:DUF4406 domain-containing protein [Deltaproteobacteria bacterium]
MNSSDIITPKTVGVISLDGDPRDWPLEERPMIYVAGYFSNNPMHGTANACAEAERLLEAGWLPVIPHINIIWDMLAPKTPDFWYRYDIALLRRCDALYVCPGVLSEHSKGVNEEIIEARECDMPVFYEIIEAKDRYLE